MPDTIPDTGGPFRNAGAGPITWIQVHNDKTLYSPAVMGV